MRHKLGTFLDSVYWHGFKRSGIAAAGVVQRLSNHGSFTKPVGVWAQRVHEKSDLMTRQICNRSLEASGRWIGRDNNRLERRAVQRRLGSPN